MKMLRRFPSLYAAASGFYRYRHLSRPTIDTPQGIKLSGNEQMEQGSFEPEETSLVQDMLKDTDVFINVGANIGYYSLLARKNECRVVAIEPLPQNVQLLTKNALANGWTDIEVLPVGAGPEPSLLKIFGGGTAASFVEGWAGASKDHYEVVSISTLDALISDRFANQRTLVLIDVEGFEAGVLKGAQRLLARDPAPKWMMEVCIDEHQPQGTRINPKLQETFQQFWNHGYRCNIALADQPLVTEEDVRHWASGDNLPSSHNFIFTKDSEDC